MSVLEILADQVAVALENARSYNLAQKAMEELRETDRIKSQFLANMSHELTNTIQLDHRFFACDSQGDRRTDQRAAAAGLVGHL